MTLFKLLPSTSTRGKNIRRFAACLGQGENLNEDPKQNQRYDVLPVGYGDHDRPSWGTNDRPDKSSKLGEGRNSQAVAGAKGLAVTRQLVSKGISFGSITVQANGAIDTSKVRGVDPDLRVRPFFAHGDTISIREFVVGAAQNEMGLQAVDPDLAVAHGGGKITTPSGMALNGGLDRIEKPPATSEAGGAVDPDNDGVTNELPASLVDYLEFYLLNYFKPAVYQQSETTQRGLQIFRKVGCATCHIQNLAILHDRRVANVETIFDPEKGIFNQLFATATPLLRLVQDESGFPPLQPPRRGPFLVRNIFADFKRHDVGSGFYERNYDSSIRKQFLTRPLWGVGSTAPYGHDGRSINLQEVILRHGGEAQAIRDAYSSLNEDEQNSVLMFLNSLVLFPPDDTASNLDPGDRSAINFPQSGHGSIKLTVLFNDPTDPE